MGPAAVSYPSRHSHDFPFIARQCKLFSPAWDAFEFTLEVGCFCPFVAINPADLGVIMVATQALCLTIFDLSPTQNTCPLTVANYTRLRVDYHNKHSVICTLKYNVLLLFGPHDATSLQLEFIIR